MTGLNQKDAGPNIANFKPKSLDSPGDRLAKLLYNQTTFCKTQAKMGQWQLAVRTMADNVDALAFHGRPDLLALLCSETACILAENGAKRAVTDLRKLADQIFVSPSPYDPERASMYEKILPLINAGVQEILEKKLGHPLADGVDVRQTIMFAPQKTDVLLEMPELLTDSHKALYRLVNEEMGPYEQNTFCLKLDSWNEMALALIQGGLGAEFPYPQRTVAAKLLQVGERDQILFCYNETDGKLEAGASAIIYEHLNST